MEREISVRLLLWNGHELLLSLPESFEFAQIEQKKIIKETKESRKSKRDLLWQISYLLLLGGC